MGKVVNFVFFYLIWLSCVIFGNIAVPFALLAITCHLIKFGDSHEVFLVLSVTILGIIVDSLLMFFNIFIFDKQPLLIPLWLMAIWMAFACTLRHSLAFFYRFPNLQFLAGAIAGPLSYYSGYLLGAVNFGHSVELTMVFLSLLWGGLFKVLMSVSGYSAKELGYGKTV